MEAGIAGMGAGGGDRDGTVGFAPRVMLRASVDELPLLRESEVTPPPPLP